MSNNKIHSSRLKFGTTARVLAYSQGVASPVNLKVKVGRWRFGAVEALAHAINAPVYFPLGPYIGGHRVIVTGRWQSRIVSNGIGKYLPK